jgi:hypothetical protein
VADDGKQSTKRRMDEEEAVRMPGTARPGEEAA